MEINAFDIVRDFEQAVADYCGAPYAVAVDSCTAALFLCLKYNREKVRKEFTADDQTDACVTIPKQTFIGVPMMAIHAGWKIRWTDPRWHQLYHIKAELPGRRNSEVPEIVDSALVMQPQGFRGFQEIYARVYSRGYVPFICLSFQYRKPLPIGRGGMILTSHEAANEWFRRARFFGRHEVPVSEEPGPTCIGWHMYMEPERAARGLNLLMHHPPPCDSCFYRPDYPDLSQYKVFEPHVVSTAH